MDTQNPSESDGRIAQALLTYLQAEDIEFDLIEHAPTATALQSAEVRGTPIEIGAKTLLMRTQAGLGLFVLSAAQQADNALVRRQFKSRYCRFARLAELYDETGLIPGSVPPFGRPILPFNLYADPSILGQSQIAFNAGLRARSIIMSCATWQRLSQPQIFAFSKQALSPPAD